MIFTRLGYVLIVAVIAVAAAAIVMVLRPDSAETNPPITVQQIIDYSRYGQIENIEARDTALIVRFREDFEPQDHFGTDSLVYEATLPEGDSILNILEFSGVAVGGENGVRVRVIE